MIDISGKSSTLRTAVARAGLRMMEDTARRVREGDLPKGDALQVARVAATQAAKMTSQLIPYCHPLPVDSVGIEFEFTAEGLRVTATVKAIHKTGVEMEALTAASIGALTIYDMAKMLDDSLAITEVVLVQKRGGKSDYREAYQPALRAAVVVMSDTAAQGQGPDRSGRLIVERLEQEGLEVVLYEAIPDDIPEIRALLVRCADDLHVDLVLTTGGTGLGPRDCTPEAMEGLLTRETPGIADTIRAAGQARTPRAMLSRGRSGMRGDTLVINLPGSTRAVQESLDALFPGVLHAFGMLRGGRHGQ